MIELQDGRENVPGDPVSLNQSTGLILAEVEDGIVTVDRQLWKKVAAAVGLELRQIESGYPGQRLSSAPWYEAEINEDVKVTMGTRFHVCSVEFVHNSLVGTERWQSFVSRFKF